MQTKLVNGFLLGFLIIMLGVILFERRDYTTRNIEVLPGMVSSLSYRPQATAPARQAEGLFRPNVEGAVVRGFARLPYMATPEDAVRAGLELKNPLEPKDSTADRERGRALFVTMCVPCHGTGGAGDGIVAQRGFPPPPSLLAENARNIKDGQIFHVLTYGQRNMPGLAGQVMRRDRWRVILYIRSLQQLSTQARTVP